jgi:predicted nucleic acid-binding protein
LIFLDTSVVVAYYLEESYSDQAQEVFRRNGSLFLSELVEVEVLSVLSRLVRVGSLDIEEAHHTGELFGEHLNAGLYARLRLQPDHYRWARDAVARFELPLKAPDAMHLAAAQGNGLRLVTADRQLARNAEALDVAFELINP